MRTLWRILVRIVFWSYERGTWQYDIAVAVIVLFVVFSPRVIHFGDQPRIARPVHHAVQLRDIEPGSVATYRVDARLVDSPSSTPELEHDLRETVRKNVQNLHDGRFEIVRIEPVRGGDGNVAYYDVSIKP